MFNAFRAEKVKRKEEEEEEEEEEDNEVEDSWK